VNRLFIRRAPGFARRSRRDPASLFIPMIPVVNFHFLLIGGRSPGSGLNSTRAFKILPYCAMKQMTYGKEERAWEN
jgi:hypothetical protein